MTRKTGYYIHFAERASIIVYDENQAIKFIRGNYDPRSFAPGRVVRVEKIVTEWYGSHDDNTRGFRDVSREDVSLEALRDGE